MSQASAAVDVDDRVLHGLYEAAAGLKQWKDAMQALDGAVGAYCSQMVVIDRSSGHLILSEQPDETPADAVLDYTTASTRIRNTWQRGR